MQTAELQLTGERTLPGIEHENYWFRRHEVAYRWATRFLHGALVVDAGCGEGYGAAELRAAADWLLAIDSDAATCRHAARRYPGLPILRGDLQSIPVRSGTVDAVVALQVVEHLAGQEAFIGECARVLRPAGTLLLSTPNRLTFSPGGSQPRNPFHTRELSAAELTALLAPSFGILRLSGLRHGRRLAGWERRHGELVAAQLASDATAWSVELRRLVRSVRVADFTVEPARIDRSLDLLVLAARH